MLYNIDSLQQSRRAFCIHLAILITELNP
ncbi:hypothetical protein NMYAN_10097 [Nitrosomonas nitrosa]|uniref:Uncharacterized protein n=1 Tax=Nitrosomonas nitrosa TaxID=52442 RepID=A0A8H9D7V8_9PROT|nr:hypothetical protein NMYAN_10097 [Nitrosomonas nitrosa]